jgi:hypothetical protein
MTASASEYLVIIVLDPQFGDRIVETGLNHDIWITPSEANRDGAKRLWSLLESRPDKPLVSMWSAPRDGATETELMGILEDVERHHGEYSHDPPVSALRVIGLPPDARVIACLEAFGYTHVEVGSDNDFVARREVPPNSRAAADAARSSVREGC